MQQQLYRFVKFTDKKPTKNGVYAYRTFGNESTINTRYFQIVATDWDYFSECEWLEPIASGGVLSAEEVLEKYETYVRSNTTPVFLKENVLKAMHEYALQFKGEQPKEEGWISSEKLPDFATKRFSVDVLCWDSENKFVYKGLYDFHNKAWLDISGDRSICSHWQPLPNPPINLK